MKSILLFSLFLLSFANTENENKKLFGEYRVEFYDNYTQSYIINFREKDYTKSNFNGETIGKGEIIENLPENEEGIIILKDYAIYIPIGKIDKSEHKSFQSECTQIWFTKKDTIHFGIYHEGNLDIAFKSGIMIKIQRK